MTPEQLITFSVVAELGNITHAARRLHLSQPAVSGQLHALQASFGEALYRRQGRGIALTPAGELLLEPANRIRAAMHDALNTRAASRELEIATLRIGASTTPASYLLPEIVAQFKRRYPGIYIQMSAGNTTDILRRMHEFDLAIVEGELDSVTQEQCEIRQWRSDEVVAILPNDHPLAGKPSLQLSELADQSLVMREDGSGVRKLIMRAFDQAGLRVQGFLELAGVEGIKQAVRAGLGVGFVSHLALKHESGNLIGVRVGCGLKRSIRIVLAPTRKPSRAAEALLNELAIDA
jgi:LysR family transcriptional regulator, low CO2-responsive transcriptional regulator